MAIRTLAGMTSDARLYAQDDNTAGNALTDAQWATLINRWVQSFASAYPEHFVIRADTKSVTFTSGIGSWTPTAVTDYNVRRVLGMRVSGSAPLERYEPHRIYELQSFDAVTGTPTKYALIPDNSSTGMTTKPNTFTMLLHKIPADGAQTILADFEFYPIDLSGSTDLPRGFGDAESRWITLLAAGTGAWLNGKDKEFVDEIVSGVPEEVQTRMNVREGIFAPRQRPAETPI